MTTRNNNLNLIFIGGPPRSGTTLIQRLVAAHPDVYGGPEFDLVPTMCEIYTQLVEKIDSGRISAWITKQHAKRAVRNLVSEIFAEKAASECVNTISEKSPSNVNVFPILAELLPDCKLIFVIRDPRSVAASLKDVGKRHLKASELPPAFTADPISRVRTISSCYQRVEQIANHEDRVIRIYYEDFIHRPNEVALWLYKRLGLSKPDRDVRELLKSVDLDADRVKGTTTHWYTEQQLKSEIKTDSLEKWRTQLSPRELYTLQSQLDVPAEIRERYQIPFEQRRYLSDRLNSLESFCNRVREIEPLVRSRRAMKRLVCNDV